MNLSLLDQAAGQSGGMLSMAMPFIMLAVMFLIMYLLIIRPQKKRDKETQAMRNNIQVGDEVVTAAGLWAAWSTLRKTRLCWKQAATAAKFASSAGLSRATNPSATCNQYPAELPPDIFVGVFRRGKNPPVLPGKKKERSYKKEGELYASPADVKTMLKIIAQNRKKSCDPFTGCSACDAII